jgi:hypothetical protein
MRVLLRVAGFVLLLSGATCAIWIVGGVLSHNPALSRMSQLLVPLVFHSACMAGGASCLNAAAKRRQAAIGAPASVS